MLPPRVLARRMRVVLGVILALALTGFCAWLFAVNWRPSPAHFPIQGIDIAEQHGPVDWHALRNAGVGFAYVRATKGASERDQRFRSNWRGAYRAGIARGALHEFSLCQLAADQARSFLAAAPATRGELPVALSLDFDPECTARPEREVLIGEIGLFLAAVEADRGRRAIVRITRRFEDRYRVSGTLHRPLWSVGGFFPPDYLARPWTMWQATRIRRVAGVNGSINWNVIAP